MEKLISRRSEIAVHAKKLGKDRDYRKQSGEFLCDGIKLLHEAVKSGAEIVSVFWAAKPDIALSGDVRVYETKKEVLESISPLKNAQDVLFICKMKQPAPIDCGKGIHILLDNVQDPGNIGTIIRSADAFGIDNVILYGGCADPYNPKSIRASMGAVFRQKLAFASIDELRKQTARFVGTGVGEGYTPLGNAVLGDTVIALGSEGQGLSGEIGNLCGETITIPISKGSESLNVAIAASIIMWESKRGNKLC